MKKFEIAMDVLEENEMLSIVGGKKTTTTTSGTVTFPNGTSITISHTTVVEE